MKNAARYSRHSKSPSIDAGVQSRLTAIQRLSLFSPPTLIETMPRLRSALGGGPELLIKRDDAITFGFGGNKVRKLEMVAAAAIEAGADTLVTTGSVQSNHARATAATAARLGMRSHLLVNGAKPKRPTANALLDELLGAEVEYVATGAERGPALHAAVERLQQAGRKPYLIPLGASTPLGALGYVHAIGELLQQMAPPDFIIHASSSGGTQAGLVAGARLHDLATRVIGISADHQAAKIESTVREILAGIESLLGIDGNALKDGALISVDDTFIGEGYAQPSSASLEAQRAAARTEALFVDHTYTAKALAALLAYVRAGRFDDEASILFWHTGGQVGLFA